MKLENQVCTLDQAKALHNLLGHNSTCYVWMRADERPAIVIPEYYNEHAPDYEWTASMGTIHEQYSAYTVAELGVMLPEVYGDNNNIIISYRPNPDWVRGMNYPPGRWLCDWDMDNMPHGGAFCETEAEARAAMLIYCLENNLTTPEEVNQRLNNA